MTPDQLDSLKWVQDCGGSMRAVNNPLATWLISEGLVSKSLGVISLTPKGTAQLITLALPSAAFTIQKWDYNTARWSWADPAPGFDEWIRKRVDGACPLIQFSLAEKTPKTLHVALDAMTRVEARLVNMAGFPTVFGDTGITAISNNIRTLMQTKNIPLVCVREPYKLFTDRIAGDIDLILSATRTTRTITAHLWT